MPILDRFKGWLGSEVRLIDRNIQTDTENAADYLKQRAAMHVAKMHRDVEDFLERMIAEQEGREAKPLTFEPMPAQATLSAPAELTGDGQHDQLDHGEPEAPVLVMPLPVFESEFTVPEEPEAEAPAPFKIPTGRASSVPRRKRA